MSVFNLLMSDIEHALENGLYVLAMTAALAVPDMCAAIEHPSGETNEERYVQWAMRWIASCEGERLLAKALYKLRCRVLHQGSLSLVGAGWAGAVPAMLLIPPNGNIDVHGKAVTNVETQKPARVYDVLKYCEEISVGAAAWLAEVISSEVVRRNLFYKSAMLRPNGIAGLIEGYPVIS